MFIDDFSRKVHVYTLKIKDEVLTYCKLFKNLVENQCQKKIKALRTDNGTEYVNGTFEIFFNEAGKIHQKSVSYTPEQNGLAERMNRTLTEKARCMLFDAKLENDLWAEAINTAAYIINRSPSRGLKDQTEEFWTGNKSNLEHLRIFGSKAMVHKGYHYILTVIDVLSKYAWAVPLKSKSESETANAITEIIR